MTQDIICPDHDYLLQMKQFPCTFNLESAGKLTLCRLRYIKHNLVSELHIGNDAEEELIRKKNLLTLVLFRLGDRNKALEVNDEVVKLTKWANMASVGNRCYIMVSIGDELEAKRCLKRLKDMRNRKYFDDLITAALAEQAYCYSRLGGTENLRLAISLFTLVVTKRPDNFLWKFGLGLVYRRATHTNIYCSSTDRLDVQGFQTLALEYLFDVGENADSNNLRAMAYAQLVKLQQEQSKHHVRHYDNLFRHNSIQQLCDLALHYGKDIPSVLTQCGRSLIPVDLERAVELLEKSVSINRNTIAYHYLGICYKKQAELQAQKISKNSSDDTQKTVEKLFCPDENLIQSRTELMRSISCDCEPDEEIIPQNDYIDRLHSFNGNTALRLDPQTQRCKEKHKTLEHKCDEATDSWKPQDELKAHVAASERLVPLNRHDRLVQNAVWCYKRAIEISNGENLPAILDLGIILKQTGQIREALTQFNSVTNSQLSLTGHRVTVISAYEHAGLCYLELSKLDGNKNNFQQDGVNKLTKAISLAADLATTISELKGCAQVIWLALRTLLNELGKEPQSTVHHKQKIHLLELVRDHCQIIEAVQKFREVNENGLADRDVIRSALVSYLELGQSENALAFLNMVRLQTGIRDVDWLKDDQMRLVRTKVLLHAIMGRLKETKENPVALFQHLFEMCYGSCVGMDVKKDQKTSVSNTTGDILIVYDDDQEIEEGQKSTPRVAHLLAELSTVFFGLEVSENLQVSFT